MPRPKGHNDYCQRCEDFNTVLDGVCCACGWNVIEKREATTEEMERASARLQIGIDELKSYFDK
jgi:hypothetical protein